MKRSKNRKSTPIKDKLANQFGGDWTYCSSSRGWDCSDGRTARRTCGCFPDDSDCRCVGIIWVYADNAMPEMLKS